MNDQRIAVITDTGTDTPREFAEEHDVRVVPLRINFPDGTTFESGVDITPAELVARMDRGVPTTSLPSPQTIRKAIERAREDGYGAAVFVTISSGLSATCDTVRLVAKQVGNFPVLVIDTLNIGLAAGMVVMEAVRQVEAGTRLDRLASALEEVASKTYVFFSVKSLSFLRKGGRISEAVYRIGSVLNIKPIITCDQHGRYVIAKKARGWLRSIEAELALAAERAAGLPKVRVGICCSASCEMFHELEERVRERIPNVLEVIRSGVSADLLVHTGPDLVGICVQGA